MSALPRPLQLFTRLTPSRLPRQCPALVRRCLWTALGLCMVQAAQAQGGNADGSTTATLASAASTESTASTVSASSSPPQVAPVPDHPAPLSAKRLTGLLSDDVDQQVAVIEALALSDDPMAGPLLAGLDDGSLVSAGGQWWLQTEHGSTALFAPKSDMAVSPDAQAVTVNNLLRSALANAQALRALAAANTDAASKRDAAKTLAAAGNALSRAYLPRLLSLRQQAHDPQTLSSLQAACAQLQLGSPAAADRLLGLHALADSSDPQVLPWVQALAGPQESDPHVRATAQQLVDQIHLRLQLGQALDRLFTGLSLGSILLLAALGLAITYGVMGVINMAHGEFLTIGAYCAYLTQTWTQHHAPSWQAVDVLLAIPLAFFSAAATGWVLERLVFRHLYGRPLETLLASWGLSLMLIQSARMLFGPQNVQVANPNWLSGSIALSPSLVLPCNRLVTLGFALAVLTLTWLLMQRTRLGLYVRAVTQNREMAACVGVVTDRIDATAFAVGAGIAGLGGVALSQIANVGPEMGQGYIVDSFMVVVLGGVGQLAGAVWAALGLGIATKLIEGWTGAVIAKILVLAFVIVFIQRRPQGLFAQRGRQLDA